MLLFLLISSFATYSGPVLRRRRTGPLYVATLLIKRKSSMATYESGNAEGPPGRHPARGARTGAPPRLRDHGSSAGRSGGHVDLPTGTVYPALPRLERAGLVQASWSAAAGRRRRVYQLTPAGRRALDSERSSWQDFSVAVTALLQPAPPALCSP